MSKSGKLRICFVGNCQSVHLQRWINYFGGKFDVCVLSSSQCSHNKCLYYEDLIPIFWKKIIYFPKIGSLVKAIFLYRYLQSKNLDFIHIHYLGTFGTSIGRFLILLRYRPLIISTWGSDIVGLTDEETIRRRSSVLENADLVTATSLFLANETKKIAPNIKRLEVVPFGTDLKVFDPARFVKSGRDDKILRVGFFKHLKLEYGAEYLIKAFKIVLSKLPNVELFIAGKGEMEENLKTLTKELRISEQVHFLGFVDDVLLEMAKMDITVMPSVSEAFGVAAIESEALEIPVVASRVGGVPEVILDGKTGFLVPPRDEEALAEAMIKLLSDKRLRLKMGKAGRELIKARYNWEENARKMENLYLEVLNKTR